MATLVVLSFALFLAVTAGLAISARYTEAVALRASSPTFGVPRRHPGETRVVLFGDDLLHGGMSDDVEKHLREHFAPCNVRLFNAARYGQSVLDVAERVDEVARVRPDFVVVQVGLLDARCIADPRVDERRDDATRRRLRSVEEYRRTLTSLLDETTRQTDARLLVVALPFLGEDLGTHLNAVIDAVNGAAHDAARAAGAHWVDFHAELERELAVARSERRARFERAGEPAPEHTPRFDEPTYRRYFRAAVLGLSLGKSGSQLSAARGLLVHTDLVHLNPRAGRVLARCVALRLTELEPRLKRPGPSAAEPAV